MEQCSFCGKPIDELKKLIRSPIRRNTYICDLCNGLISSIISEKGGKKKMRRKRKGRKIKEAFICQRSLDILQEKMQRDLLLNFAI